MKHKHAEMIKAKADNMELVVFRKNYDNSWGEIQCHDCCFMPDFEYFLCLPKHKEACLHWLNGGEYQVNQLPPEDMLSIDDTLKRGGWTVDHWFMSDVFTFRIKPRKEKRWMGFNKHTKITTSTLYKSLDDVKAATLRHEEWQFIEIEVEL